LVDHIEEEINNKAPSENKSILLLASYYLYMNEKLGDCIKVLDVSSINPSITIGHDCQFKRVLPSLWLQSCHLFSSKLADGCDPALCMPCHSGYYSFYKVLRRLEAIRVIVIVTIKATPHHKLVKE
jgi:hypothetical protein